MKVLIARPTGELPRFYEYYDSVDALITPPGTDVLPVHSSSPAKNRNQAIIKAIEADIYTHIFFTDDDHVYPPNTLMRLLSHDVDIVSVMYTVKFHPFPIIALENTGDANMGKFINMNLHPPNKLVLMPRVPAGGLLVKVSAMKILRSWINEEVCSGRLAPKFKDKFFTLGQLQPDEWADDLWFCDRAYEAGLDIYLDTGAPIGHITKCVLMPFWNGAEWEIKFSINEGYRIGQESA